MKVLVVSHSYVALENQKNIAALQHYAEVQVALPHFIEDRVSGKVAPPANESETYSVYRRICLPRSQYLLKSADLGMKAFRPDIIHIEYDPWAPIFWQTWLARKWAAPHARIVCTAKKNTLRQLPQPLQMLKLCVANTLLKSVAHLLVINKGVQRIYQHTLNVPPDKMTLMQHLGIDMLTFFPAAQRMPDTQLTIGYCGRFDPHKGLADLVSAVAAINEARPGSARLKVLGQGAMRDELVAKAYPWLDVLPPVPHAQVADFMRGLDIFVMPSLVLRDHEEHDGHALMEAMACGVPSIGSTSGIIPELLSDDCGLIYPAGDAQALAACLSTLLSSAQERSALAARGLARAKEAFTVEGIALMKSKIYQKVLA